MTDVGDFVNAIQRISTVAAGMLTRRKVVRVLAPLTATDNPATGTTDIGFTGDTGETIVDLTTTTSAAATLATIPLPADLTVVEVDYRIFATCGVKVIAIHHRRWANSDGTDSDTAEQDIGTDHEDITGASVGADVTATEITIGVTGATTGTVKWRLYYTVRSNS